jgi:serine/threonine-protein kinase
VDDLAARLADAVRGRYTVQGPLGEGGMAVVWRAHDDRHGRLVALKVLRPEIAAVLGSERFQREVSILARLQHPNVLPLLDSGSAGGLLWYAMPLVEGETLRRRLDRERQLPVQDAVRLGAEIAGALDYSHRQGLVHRDVKPENVLLADGHAVVSDFGIARAMSPSDERRLTESGVTLGTMAYVSPEQAAGAALDGRSDQYSLACVVYEMLAGQGPFPGALPENVVHQHLSVTPRPVTEQRPGTPAGLAEVLQRALLKTPADRFATMADFAEALLDSLGGVGAGAPTGAGPPSAASRTDRGPARRANRMWLAGSLVAGAVAIAALWLAISPSRDARGAAADAARRPWVWVAEFEGPADDPDLARTTRDLVAAAIDQSGLVASVPDDQVRAALRLAVRPETTRVTAALARELAVRTSVPVVVEGRIGRLGGGYAFVLRATRSSNGGEVVTVDETTRDADGLLAAVERGARGLRRALGERGASLASERPIREAITPSFEAFQHFARAMDLMDDDQAEEALPDLRTALGLDSAFVDAWAALGTAHFNLARFDSGRADFERGLRHPERLTTRRRLDIEAKLAIIADDNERAVEATTAILRTNPNPGQAGAALHNRAICLESMGRFEEAAADYRRALQLFPVQSSTLTLMNACDLAITRREPVEAESLAMRLAGVRRDARLAQVAALRGQWTAAESLAGLVVHRWREEPWEAVPAAVLLGALQARRGELRAAATTFEGFQREQIAARRPPIELGGAWMPRWWLADVSGERWADSPPDWTRELPPIGRMAYAVSFERSAEARSALEAWIEMRGDVDRAYLERILDGFEAYQAKRWDDAYAQLGPFARERGSWGPAVERLRILARWRLANVFERLGQPDSAAAYLTLAIDPPVLPSPALQTSLLLEPFARHRMVLLHVRSGNVGAARREYDRLAATFTRPDPDRVAWLAEAREAVRAAETMGEAGRP